MKFSKTVISLFSAFLFGCLLTLTPVIQTSRASEIKSFSEWCLNRESLSVAARSTVDYILFQHELRNLEKSGAFTANLDEDDFDRLVDQAFEQIGKADCNQANQELVKLTTLTVKSSEDVDLHPIASLNNLKNLTVIGKTISDLTPLITLKSLAYLTLIPEHPMDLHPLSKLSNLSHLQITGIGNTRDRDSSDQSCKSQFKDIHLKTISSKFKSLNDYTSCEKTLPIQKISTEPGLNLEPIADLTQLKGLVLTWNGIRDIRALAGLTNLTELGLFGNELSDLQPLSKLTRLQWLFLSYNKIQNLQPLSTLVNLQELDLIRNQIRDVSPLASLTKLSQLLLAGNPLDNKNCPVKPASICNFDTFSNGVPFSFVPAD